MQTGDRTAIGRECLLDAITVFQELEDDGLTIVDAMVLYVAEDDEGTVRYGYHASPGLSRVHTKLGLIDTIRRLLGVGLRKV